MLKIFLRQNKTATAKAKFNFRSENVAEISFDSLIDEMAQNNTTVTRADIKGVMDVYKTVLLRYVQLGFRVRGALGLLYVTAGGTTNDSLEVFNPSITSNDHSLSLRFLPDANVSKSVTDNTKMTRVSNRFKMIPSIDEIQNADDRKSDVIQPGDIIRIFGDYLKFDANDMDQGIFLEKDGILTRLDYYTWNANKRVDAKIPLAIENGTYAVRIAACPCSVLYNEKSNKVITIT